MFNSLSDIRACVNLRFNAVKNWFKHSETIFWNRLQIVMGIVWIAVSATDLSPLLSPKWFAIWGIANGIIGETLRRRNTVTVTTMVPVANTDIEVPVVTLVTPQIKQVP